MSQTAEVPPLTTESKSLVRKLFYMRSIKFTRSQSGTYIYNPNTSIRSGLKDHTVI